MVVEYGFPGTYWLMKPDGVRLSSTVNESQLAKWIERDRLGNQELNPGTNQIAPAGEENSDTEIVTQIGYLDVALSECPQETWQTFPLENH